MIGLVDYSLQNSTSEKLYPPNLEIMKLATYYKLEENTFCRLINLNETEFTGYDKIYFFSEQEEPIIVPPQFLRANNVIYGGTAFTKGIYHPFENEIIDYTLPKTFIYKEYLKQKYIDGIKANVIEHLLDDTYYRYYANSKLPIPPIKKRHKFFLYDINFFQPDWEDLIDEISSHKPTSIICVHPIVCHTLTEYFKVREKSKIARLNTIILELNVPLNEVHYMLETYKNQFLADITQSSNVCISLGGTFKTRYHYYNDLIYKLNLLYSFWAYSIPLKITYVYPKLGAIDPLQHLSQKIARWSYNLKTNGTIDSIIVLKTKASRTLAYNERLQFLKIKPEAADLFKQNYTLISQRRYWKI